MSKWDQLEKVVNGEGEDGFLMMPETRRIYNSRRLASRDVPLLSRPVKSQPWFVLPVVSGPSGSGKTWFMIHAKKSNELGLYFTASDLQFPENVEPKDSYSLTQEILAAAVSKLVSARVKWLLDLEGCGLFVVVDEMGTSPHLLRALCDCALELEGCVQKALGVSIPCDFMVGGCGADRMDLSCGSMPDKQRLLKLPTDSLRVWESLVSEHKKAMKSDTRAQGFLQVLETDATALRLATNPRAAVLMLEELKARSSPLWAELGKNPSPEVIKRALPLFFAEVAKGFRQRSRMCDLESKEQLEQIYQEALALVQQKTKKEKKNEEEKQQEEAVKRKLIGTYAVVMDEALEFSVLLLILLPLLPWRTWWCWSPRWLWCWSACCPSSLRPSGCGGNCARWDIPETRVHALLKRKLVWSRLSSYSVSCVGCPACPCPLCFGC